MEFETNLEKNEARTSIDKMLDKCFCETNPNLTPAMDERGIRIADLANRLYMLLSDGRSSRKTEKKLAAELETSIRQIKYAKRLLERRGDAVIRHQYNHNRDNPKHEILLLDGSLATNPRESAWKIDWSLFGTWTANQLNDLTIEETLDLYEDMRFRFIPLHFPKWRRNGEVFCSCSRGRSCEDIGKHPAVKSTKTLDFSKSSTYVEMRSYWIQDDWSKRKADTRYNVGLLIDNFSVIDIDPRNGGYVSLESIEELFGELPINLMSSTGDGHHRYVADSLVNDVNILGFPGIDVKSNGSYIIAPPSRHANGNKYTWTSVGVPAMLPPDLRKAINTQVITKKTNRNQDRFVLNNGQPILPGDRNDTLYRMASAERGRGSDYAQLREFISRQNRALCNPPIHENEVSQIAKSAVRWPTNAEKQLALAP